MIKMMSVIIKNYTSNAIPYCFIYSFMIYYNVFKRYEKAVFISWIHREVLVGAKNHFMINYLSLWSGFRESGKRLFTVKGF